MSPTPVQRNLFSGAAGVSDGLTLGVSEEWIGDDWLWFLSLDNPSRITCVLERQRLEAPSGPWVQQGGATLASPQLYNIFLPGFRFRARILAVPTGASEPVVLTRRRDESGRRERESVVSSLVERRMNIAGFDLVEPGIIEIGDFERLRETTAHLFVCSDPDPGIQVDFGGTWERVPGDHRKLHFTATQYLLSTAIDRVAGGGGTLPPPTGVTSTRLDAVRTTLDVAWTPPSDVSEIDGYRVFIDGVLRAEVPGITARILNVALDAALLEVRAYNDSGEVSPSASAAISAGSGGSVILPPPTGLQVNPTPGQSTTLAVYIELPPRVSPTGAYTTAEWDSWSWQVYVDGQLRAITTEGYVAIGNLAANEQVSVSVRTLDPAGNVSTPISRTATPGGSTSGGSGQPSDAWAQTLPSPTNVRGTRPEVTSGTDLNIFFGFPTVTTGITGYEIFLNGTYIATVTGGYHYVSGLTPGTTYPIAVRAIDANGQRRSVDAIGTGSTSDAGGGGGSGGGTGGSGHTSDGWAQTLGAPTINSVLPPAGVDGETRLDVLFGTPTDTTGITGYEVFVDGVFDQKVTTGYAQITGLSAGATYTIAVRSIDEVNQHRSTDDTEPGTTRASGSGGSGGTGLPNVTDLRGSVYGPTSLELFWTPAPDGSGVTGYEIKRRVSGGSDAVVGTLSGRTTSSFYEDTLSPDTTYIYTVTSADGGTGRSDGVSVTLSTAP